MKKDESYYKKIEENCVIQIKEIGESLGRFSIVKITQIDELHIFIAFIEKVSSYIAFLNLLFKVRRMEKKGVEGSYIKSVIRFLIQMEKFFSSFAEKDLTQLLPEREKNNEFVDEIKEVDKIEIFRHLMVNIEIFNANIEDGRIVASFFRDQVLLVARFKNWFNFKKMFSILDDPSHEEHIFVSTFLKLFFKNLFCLAEECHNLFEISIQSDRESLYSAVDLLHFLIKVENIRRDEFFDDFSLIKKTSEVWQKKLDR